ncbi:MAG: hypothetical protein Q8R28_11430 [Dehalococcoidia bacterium]|nr:hypothetical protein [Dehalococcoidia bacterium]
MPKYDVHTYMVVRAMVVSVEAETMEKAIERVNAEFTLYRELFREYCHCCEEGNTRREEAHLEHIEDTEEVTGYLVDLVGDTEYSMTRLYAADGVTVEGPLS